MPLDLNPILIVDDEEDILEALSEHLKSAGYQSITARNGKEAFQILSERAQELGTPLVSGILCDWKMPEWDGLKLLNEIRNATDFHVPFILMSGAVTREELEQAAKNKADAILVKPVTKGILLAKIKQVIASF